MASPQHQLVLQLLLVVKLLLQLQQPGVLEPLLNLGTRSRELTHQVGQSKVRSGGHYIVQGMR